MSPFVGARGRAIASPLLTLADDGSIPGMRGSTLFDDEGVAAWEQSLQLDPSVDAVKRKLQDMRTRLRRTKGERSKAGQ